MIAPTWRLLCRPACDVQTEAPCGTSVAVVPEALAFWRGRLKRVPWYRRAARGEARQMVARWQRRMLQASSSAGSCARSPAPCSRSSTGGPTCGLAARRVTRRVLRASPVARMVALAAAAVTVIAVAMLALIVVAIAQLV
jgi:hypothetical protein